MIHSLPTPVRFGIGAGQSHGRTETPEEQFRRTLEGKSAEDLASMLKDYIGTNKESTLVVTLIHRLQNYRNEGAAYNQRTFNAIWASFEKAYPGNTPVPENLYNAFNQAKESVKGSR